MLQCPLNQYSCLKPSHQVLRHPTSMRQVPGRDPLHRAGRWHMPQETQPHQDYSSALVLKTRVSPTTRGASQIGPVGLGASKNLRTSVTSANLLQAVIPKVPITESCGATCGWKMRANHLTCLVENTANTMYSQFWQVYRCPFFIIHSTLTSQTHFPHKCVWQARDTPPPQPPLPRNLLWKRGSGQPAGRDPKGQSPSEGALHPPGTKVGEQSHPKEAQDLSGVKHTVLSNAQVLAQPPRAEDRKCQV